MCRCSCVSRQTVECGTPPRQQASTATPARTRMLSGRGSDGDGCYSAGEERLVCRVWMGGGGVRNTKRVSGVGRNAYQRSVDCVESVPSAVPYCPAAYDALTAKHCATELRHLHRAHPSSPPWMPNGLACRGLSCFRHSHACHSRTSSEGAKQWMPAAHSGRKARRGDAVRRSRAGTA